MRSRDGASARSQAVLQAFTSRERRTNLVTTLTETLRRQIFEGHLRPGDRLPTEAELGASAGVSRTVVREAVASLKAEGLVETRQGTGAFVLAPPKRLQVPGDIEKATLEDILYVLELRLAVEVEAASLAASRRGAADLAAMEKALDHFAAALEQGGDSVTADLRFHKALAEATRNPYFINFLDYLGEFALPRRHLTERLRKTADMEDHLDRVAKEHRAIYDAVAAGDTAMAAFTMRVHLGGSRARYSAAMRDSQLSDAEPV